jgi:hypothetical protein
VRPVAAVIKAGLANRSKVFRNADFGLEYVNRFEDNSKPIASMERTVMWMWPEAVSSVATSIRAAATDVVNTTPRASKADSTLVGATDWFHTTRTGVDRSTEEAI